MTCGLYGALFTAMSTFLATFWIVERNQGLRAGEATIAAAVTFSSHMVSRGIAKGLIDSNRRLTKADVGQMKGSLKAAEVLNESDLERSVWVISALSRFGRSVPLSAFPSLIKAASSASRVSWRGESFSCLIP
jgi:hypothetical protein